MERAQEELALTQIRKSVEKLGSSTESYGDPTLMRFLIARAMDPEKAAKMFVQWRQWRAAFVPLGYIPDSEVPDELESRKICLQGLSKNGFPVMIVKGRNHFPAKDQLQFKKFVVHLLDKTLASSSKDGEIGSEKLIGILDLQHISYKNVDARALITGFQFLQAYYPERLAKFYLLHMPLFFVAVWKLVSRFLEKATLEKIVIVSNEEERLQLMREVGEDVLPEEYGGKSKFVAMQDVVINPLAVEG
ncbi:PREDICTED: CRAL-TRIO domain-containing protein YKL091C isoform X1 [Ipomoea nil]|uniref:CRAL-TRIO domain-containing protein YKL091C isoform X1 n=1 Tax=Ipomoea nil TaxID=35883 RepID=UPI00090187AC|nr:PREDICTED: CRAL-TRIO domain-containing protein YKL091C isoform X1 [Ipomoea nil]